MSEFENTVPHSEQVQAKCHLLDTEGLGEKVTRLPECSSSVLTFNSLSRRPENHTRRWIRTFAFWLKSKQPLPVWIRSELHNQNGILCSPDRVNQENSFLFHKIKKFVCFRKKGLLKIHYYNVKLKFHI